MKQSVEVVITSYNQGKMISEALDSVCRQTMLPDRVIIVDDGSGDENTIQVLRNIEKKSFLIPVTVHYQQNKGVSAARNKGISMTMSPFVLILDGDDRLKQDYIERVSR